mgnify:CR=1 FL=1
MNTKRYQCSLNLKEGLHDNHIWILFTSNQIPDAKQMNSTIDYAMWKAEKGWKKSEQSNKKLDEENILANTKGVRVLIRIIERNCIIMEFHI